MLEAVVVESAFLLRRSCCFAMGDETFASKDLGDLRLLTGGTFLSTLTTSSRARFLSAFLFFLASRFFGMIGTLADSCTGD